MSKPVALVSSLVVVGLIVIVLHLAPGLDKSLVEIQIRNALHVLGFAAVAALTVRLTPGGTLTRAAIALLVPVMIGAASEFVQQVAGNAFDIEDLYRDAAGATLFVVAWLLWNAPVNLRLGALGKLTLRSLAVLSCAAIFVPMVYWGGVVVLARAQSPVIHDFSHSWSHYFVGSINATQRIEGDGPGAHVSVTLSRRPRSGVTLAVAARNWRDAEYLLFDAWISVDAPTTLSAHINDGRHMGRFRDSEAGTVIVSQVPTGYRVSIAQIISETQAPDNLGDIRQVVILGRDRTDGAVLHIDNIRIE